MAIFSRVLIGLAIILVAGTVVSGQEECKGDVEGLMKECGVYVQRPGAEADPSAACCNVVKTADIPCACRHITPEVQKVIDMNKVVHVAAFCGKPLPHGIKCGSYTVP